MIRWAYLHVLSSPNILVWMSCICTVHKSCQSTTRFRIAPTQSIIPTWKIIPGELHSTPHYPSAISTQAAAAISIHTAYTVPGSPSLIVHTLAPSPLRATLPWPKSYIALSRRLVCNEASPKISETTKARRLSTEAGIFAAAATLLPHRLLDHSASKNYSVYEPDDAHCNKHMGIPYEVFRISLRRLTFRTVEVQFFLLFYFFNTTLLISYRPLLQF